MLFHGMMIRKNSHEYILVIRAFTVMYAPGAHDINGPNQPWRQQGLVDSPQPQQWTNPIYLENSGYNRLQPIY